MTRKDKLIKFLSANRNIIYYSVVLIFIGAGLFYAIKGYNYYQGMERITSGGDLMGVIFTPFILAAFRFVMVASLGLFIATVIIAIPLRKIKVMQFEVEFAEKASEIAAFQDKHYNQINFLQKLLEEEDYFVGKYYTDGIDSFRLIAEDILTSYESFFNEELKTNLHVEVFDQDEAENIADTRLKKLTKMIDPLEKDYLVRNRSVIGHHMLILGIRDGEKDLYVVLSSSEYEFGKYDVKILKSLMNVSLSFMKNVYFLESIE